MSAVGRLGDQPPRPGRFFTPGRAPDSAPKQLARRTLRLAQTRFGGFFRNCPRPPRGPAKPSLHRVGRSPRRSIRPPPGTPLRGADSRRRSPRPGEHLWL